MRYIALLGAILMIACTRETTTAPENRAHVNGVWRGSMRDVGPVTLSLNDQGGAVVGTWVIRDNAAVFGAHATGEYNPPDLTLHLTASQSLSMVVYASVDGDQMLARFNGWGFMGDTVTLRR